MIRVVLDTNIIVSAYLNEDGLPFRILKLALAGAIDLYASEQILEEYKELLQRKSYPLDSRRAALLLKKLRGTSTLVQPAIKLSETTDPDDNIFLECAQAAKAEYLVIRRTLRMAASSGHYPWSSPRSHENYGRCW
jgi:putative PIN family toxin of toxin-antitoxin system